MTIICFALAFFNFTVLISLSCLHLYWAFGGKAGIKNAVPSNEQGKEVIHPGKMACIVVTLLLAASAFLFLDKVEILRLPIPPRLYQYGIYGVAIIFFLRSIGDFKYVGFTKKIKTTAFGKLDTKYYSPLCLLISVNSVVLERILKTLPQI